MSSATTSKKSQPTSPTSTPSTSDKKNPGSNTSTKQKDPQQVTKGEILRLFRAAREKNAKMTPEEVAKAYPWTKQYKNTTPATADQVSDLWDEI
ncbi:hypothetical protein F4781DRAFT_165308 [Annulohypoxylon bovei var. microspora]|nr:hypothetical protein F4781DRAFT_165308 [Annulohypoxylon bovei var. microspora]